MEGVRLLYIVRYYRKCWTLFIGQNSIILQSGICVDRVCFVINFITSPQVRCLHGKTIYIPNEYLCPLLEVILFHFHTELNEIFNASSGRLLIIIGLVYNLAWLFLRFHVSLAWRFALRIVFPLLNRLAFSLIDTWCIWVVRSVRFVFYM